MTLKQRLKQKVRAYIGMPMLSPHAVETLEPSRKHSKALLGRMLARLNEQLPNDAPISAMEFQVFSQMGDDGIIQFLISRLPIASRTFIEFGVEDYREANTRFLLVNDRWSGLVMDGDPKNVAYIQSDIVSWYHRLQSTQAFITRENINQLIAAAGFPEEPGILSIDLDGVDYWIWEAIDCVRPTIVISEYNSVFGADSYLTVPYRPDFQWSKDGDACYYWGTSLGALAHLAERKGYDLFGCNSAGNNAYFIRKDRRGALPKAEVAKAYVEGQFTFVWDEKTGPVRGKAGLPFLKGRKFIDVRDSQEVVL